jgi:hypothetical protein
MKCFIRDDMLIVRGLFRIRFHASPSDLIQVKVMTEHDYYGPFTWLCKWLFGNKIRLRFIMLQTDDNEISLDVRRDRGTSDVISWLRDAGWDIDSAVQEAMKTPLVRVTVPRMQSY